MEASDFRIDDRVLFNASYMKPPRIMTGKVVGHSWRDKEELRLQILPGTWLVQVDIMFSYPMTIHPERLVILK